MECDGRAAVLLADHPEKHAMDRPGRRRDAGSESGAPRGTRTPDPLITNQMLYQLSYRGHAFQIPLPPRARKGSVLATGHDDHGQKPDRHHEKRCGGGFGQALKARQFEDPGRERVVVEGAQEQRRGEFLHAIDEDDQ